MWFLRGDRLGIDIQTGNGISHSLLQEPNAKMPNSSVFPKNDLMLEKPNDMNENAMRSNKNQLFSRKRLVA